MRIVMISKAVVVGIYQRKLEEMARLPGVELTVVAPPSWRDPSGEIPLERAFTSGYDLRVEPIRFNGNFHFYYFPTLARLLNDIRPNIVHIDEEPYNFASWHSLFQAQRIGAKSLFFTWQNIYKKYPVPFSWGEHYVLNRVDYALAGTESAAAVYREKGYRGPMAVIPQFGVDPDMFSPKPPTSRNSSSQFVIGYVGRLVEEKGIDLLIRALAKVKGDWQLQLIGQGPERSALEQLVQTLGLSEQVRFVGQYPSTQMPQLYHSLDVLVIPSRTKPNWKEQFGRVITEAMASGVPVIGSDSGAIPDIVGDAGLIFPEENSDALADHLQSLMNDHRLYNELSARGRTRLLEKFTHAQIASQTINVYRDMIER